MTQNTAEWESPFRGIFYYIKKISRRFTSEQNKYLFSNTLLEKRSETGGMQLLFIPDCNFSSSGFLRTGAVRFQSLRRRRSA